jgi:hypothetical protein
VPDRFTGQILYDTGETRARKRDGGIYIDFSARFSPGGDKDWLK